MDVFKNLVDELKEENLLEETVINSCNQTSDFAFADPINNFAVTVEEETLASADDSSNEVLKEVGQTREEIINESQEKIPDSDVKDAAVLTPKPSNGREFYKKRAVGEMSHLQMVEHVFTGVEREYMKIVPKVFDDFAAKKALNTFLKVSEDENSPQHSEAEFAMMQETEAWCTALAERDRSIPVANIRQYCENSRPALSSQALVALARFYRNVPYSESVRSKFDFIITRLFSRPAPGNKRQCLFTRDEMLGHISLLYNEWSSVPLYAADDDNSKVMLTALSFEELASEAENASTFDLLVANDFFGRLGLFKESVSELFFAPNVTAAAIDCNIRVGNAYVTLIDNERTKMDGQTMYSKFGTVDNLTVSDAAARTLEIVDILRKQRDSAEQVSASQIKVELPAPKTDISHPSPGNREENLDVNGKKRNNKNGFVSKGLAINRWLFGGAVFLIVVFGGLFAWSTFSNRPHLPDMAAKTIELPNSDAKTHLKTARINGPNFYGLLLPSWDTLPKEKREEYLKVVYELAKEKGCSQVNLLDSQGNAAAFASDFKSEVVMP